MLFISNPPVQIEVLQDKKIIILGKNKIMFSHLQFIQQYLSMPLINTNPKKMCYQSSVMQAMVVSETTVEVYYCDWKTQIKLLKVIILNNQTVDNFWYRKNQGWQIQGSLCQYQPTKITFHDSEQKTSDLLAGCYVNEQHYLLTKEKFCRSKIGGQKNEIAWKDRMMVLKNCNYKIHMIGSQSLDKKKDLICINQTYVLIVMHLQAFTVLIQPVVQSIKNDLLISHIEKGKLTSIKKLESSSFVQIGVIHKEKGDLCGAFLYSQSLILLNYDQKQVRVDAYPLTEEIDDKNIKCKNEKRKRLAQSISKIIEEEHEEGSQFINSNNDLKSGRDGPSQRSIHKQSDYNVNQKPIIRDITANDEDIKSDNLNDSSSEVLSRSGLENYDDIQVEQNKKKNQWEQKTGPEKTNFESQRFQSVPISKRMNIETDLFSTQSLHKKRKREKKAKQNESLIDELSLDEQKPDFVPEVNKVYTHLGNSKNESFPTGNLKQITEQVPNTPDFGFSGFGSDKWVQYDKQWNQLARDKISQQVEQQMVQSVCISDEKSLLKFTPDTISKKVSAFKPDNGLLTAQIYYKIQKSSYCTLISKAISQDCDRIQHYLDLFLPQILDEDECPLFFQTNIRTYNPQFTQQKIRYLFKSIINVPSMKPKITSALQLFQLNQVPCEVLTFPSDFIKILNIICRQIYIEDLLKPTQTLLQYILTSYFSVDKFSEEIIAIEDETIDISHPRNMLNILLYLNESFSLDIEIVLSVFCSKLIEEEYFDILQKMIEKQNIFEICQISRSVIDNIITQKFNDLLKQSSENIEYLWNLVQLLSPHIIDQYRIKLAVVNELVKSGISFEIKFVLEIRDHHNQISIFFEKIIQQNDCRSLVNLKYSNLYRSLYWLQQGYKLKYATNEYIEIVKVLSQKLCQMKYFYRAFLVLNQVIKKIKPSFIAKILISYLNSKYVNRIAEKNEIKNLEKLFPQLTNNPDLDVSKLPNDSLTIPQFSQSFSCTWPMFNSIVEKYFKFPMQLRILIYKQLNTAIQIFLSFQENIKNKFLKFLEEVDNFIVVELDSINYQEESYNPKGITSIKFELKQYYMESEPATSINRDDLLMQDDRSYGKKRIYKSMTLIDHYNVISKTKLIRRNSDQKCENDDGSEELMRIKLLVNSSEIIQELRQTYGKRGVKMFLRSLKSVDLEKVKLYHLDTFKAITYKQIDYNISKILPFQVFLAPDPKQAFQIAKQDIISELSANNFWIIFTVIQLMFSLGREVGWLFVKKCIEYLRSDQYHMAIKAILDMDQGKKEGKMIDRYIEQANCYQLVETKKILQQYRQSTLIK